MIKKQERITKKKEFERIFKDGKSSYNKILGIKALDNKLNINRLGVIVGNKVSKRAVDRNKIKRQIRASIKKVSSQLKVGHDLIVIALPTILDKEFNEIEGSIKKRLKKLKIFNQENKP